MPFLISKLDSNRFGFPVAKVDQFSEPIPDSISQLRAMGVKLVISRVRSDDIRTVGSLEARGFRVMDTQLTYRYDYHTAGGNDTEPPVSFVLREFAPPDLAAIVGVAAAAFDNYGHYANDPRIDPRVCRDIYIDWARRSCTEPGVADKIVIAERDDVVVGYLSFKLRTTPTHSFAVGGMGAVSSAHRGAGVFSAIVRYGLQWGRDQGQDWQEHNVVAANLPVNHAFVNCGFKPSASWVTLHGWVD